MVAESWALDDSLMAEIGRAFQVPKFMLGTQSANYASAVAHEQQFRSMLRDLGNLIVNGSVQ